MNVRMQPVRTGDWLRMNAEKYPERDCFVTADERFNFAHVNARVNKLVSQLSRLGVGPGDRIALFATDSHRYAETLLASLKMGTTYVPLNFRLAAPELRNLLKAANPRCLFYSQRYADMVAEIVADIPSIAFTVAYEGGTGSYEDLVAGGVEEEPDHPIDDEGIAGLCFTSGTTGLPKGVMHSHRMTKHLTYQTIFERRLPAEAFHYSPAPLYHVAGMLYVTAGVARGHTTLLLPAFEPAEVLRWMHSGELTGCFLVPTMISALLQHPDVGAGSYESIQSIAYGGSPMTPALLRRAMDVFDCDFLNMFGAGTEAGLQTLLTPEDHRRAMAGQEHLLGSIGKPAFGVDVRIVDADMKDVPRGDVGEIVSRADAVMSGYLDQSEATARAFADGWFRGGDMAWQDDEGYLYLSGRRDDMVIRGGENIYPVEIESVLADYAGVVEVAVVGVANAHWGETVRAHVVMASGSRPDPDEMRAFCRSRLASYKVPQEFRFEDELPRNASGKILKRILRSQP